MSASEKLKTLDANVQGFHAPLAIDMLTAALPQIVAVVEAAENDMDYLSRETLGKSFVVPETTTALCDALTALEEALS